MTEAVDADGELGNLAGRAASWLWCFEPQTLTEAIRYYSDEQTCIDTLAALRCPDGQVYCSGCGEIGNTIWLSNQKRWKCRGCKKQFFVKVNTIFQDSPIGLDKWMVAVVDAGELPKWR